MALHWNYSISTRINSLQVSSFTQVNINFFRTSSIFTQRPQSDPSAGIAVSAAGMLFSNYPPTLDANNTKYGIAELTTSTSETPYPSVEFNSPPEGFISYTTTPPS